MQILSVLLIISRHRAALKAAKGACGELVVIITILLWLFFVTGVMLAPRLVLAMPGVPDSAFPHPYGGYVHPHWNSDCSEFWYESFGENWTRKFWWINTTSGERASVFNNDQLYEAMGKLGIPALDSAHIPLIDVQRLPSGKLQLDLNGQRFTYDPAANKLERTPAVPSVARPLAPLADIPTTLTNTLEETTVTFFNRKKRHISIFQALTGGAQFRLTSPIKWLGVQEWCAKVGEVFIIKDELGNTLGIFQAIGDPSQVDIDPLPIGRPPSLPSRALASQPSSPLLVLQTLRMQDGNMFLTDRQSGNEVQLTTDGRPGNGYDEQSDGEGAPNGEKLLITRQISDAQNLNLVQSSPADDIQPKLLTGKFNRPTDSVRVMQPELFDLVNRHKIPIRYVQAPVTPCCVKGFEWSEDSKNVDFTEIDRDRHTARVVRVDADSGNATAIIAEHSETFVDFLAEGKSERRELAGAGGFLWTSERDGWNHAYYYDHQGKLKSQVTRGKYVVRGVFSAEPASENSTCILKVGGFNPYQDPYYIHYVLARLDGSSVLDLTPGDGTHEIQLSPDGQCYLDTYSRVDLAAVTALYQIRSCGGRACVVKICEVDKADMRPRIAAGWVPPERFVAKGRDGKTDIFGVIYRPPSFNPLARYPVIEHVYAGPQQAGVCKVFNEWSEEEALARCGFIVVESDGMGTNFRSKAFHDVVWHNLADAGFPDRIAWIKAAAAKYPQMDISRLGIYGTSSGAENAVRALESHGDFYHLAVAGFGIYDDRTTSLAEQWMGWPVGAWYEAQSDVKDATDLKGNLLLFSGELDHTADPAFTMQLVNALIKANKDFEFLELPNADHGQYGDYGLRKRAEFFIHNLLQRANR